MRTLPLLCLLSVAACGARRPVEVPEPRTAGLDPEVGAALEHARDAVRAAPEDLAARIEYAAVLDANELDEAAEEAWRQVTERAPREAKPWYHLARVRERRGESGPALEALAHVLELAPDYAPAHLRCGRLRLELGALDEAQPALERALLLEPGSLQASMAFARLLLLRARAAEAIAVLEPLVQRNPRETYLNGLLARAWAMQGDEERAQSYLEAEDRAGQFTARDPWQAEVERHECGLRVRIERARARLAAGDAKGAWQELEPLASREDELAVVAVQCQVLLELGRAEEVLQRVARAEAKSGANSLLSINRVLALRALGRASEALAEIEAEVRRNPAHPNGHALHGEVLFAAERFAEAATAFGEARARGDASLGTWLDLGRARAAAGDLSGGLHELEQAAAGFPSAPKPWAYRCEFLALEGQHEEARRSLEEARKRGLEPELVAVVRARLDELAAEAGK